MGGREGDGVNIHCRHPDCNELVKISVNCVEGIARYTIEVCFEHGEWAEKYLEKHIPRYEKEGDNASERVERENRTK